MFKERIEKLLSIEYENKLIIFDEDNFSSIFNYIQLLKDNKFSVIEYNDVEEFRYKYESELKDCHDRIAVIVKTGIFVPHDILKAFHSITLSLESLYPRFNVNALMRHINDIELIDLAYKDFYDKQLDEEATEDFIMKFAYSKKSVRDYILVKDSEISRIISEPINYNKWIDVAKQNARIEKYAAMHNIKRDQSYINNKFKEFVNNGYQKLSSVSSRFPVILPRVLNDIAKGKKTALIVADGMSLFDFEVFSDSLGEFDFDYNGSFALIPTVTGISRQALLAGKYPQQLPNQFSLAKEEQQFKEKLQELGYPNNQLFFGHGYNNLPGPSIKFASIIVNDFDDIIHGQLQGHIGMRNDINVFSSTNKLQNLIICLLNDGFEVYLTSDHGNTECIGTGSIKKFGIETETRSKRMVVLKSFADVIPELQDKTEEYPGHYMDKSFKYLICKDNTTFDNVGADIMTHGGITIEEVIVPFIKFRRKNNG